MRFKHRKAGKALLVYIVLLTLVGSVAVWFQSQSTSGAAANQQQDREPRKLGNYDIRDDRSEEARAMVGKKRQKGSKGQAEKMTGLERAMSVGRGRLKSRIPDVEIVDNDGLKVPEIVGVLSEKKKLTGKSGAKRQDIVRGFLRENKDLYGLTLEDVNSLKAVSDHENPAGNMSFVELEQEIDGVPVFQGYIRGGLSKDGELVRTTGTLVPGFDRASAKREKDSLTSTMKSVAMGSIAAGDSSAAVAISEAAESIGVEMAPSQVVLKESSEDGTSFTFEGGPFVEDIRAELVYFPLESGNVTLAWSMILWEDVPAYYTIVDAETGTVLWRKNITNEQTQPVTYSIYSDESPAPLSPFTGTPVVPAVAPGGFQAPFVGRTTMTLISEHPSNNLGWITDGGTTTTGNNVDAGLDLVSPNGIDAGTRPVSPTRVFDFPYDPSVDAPSTANYRAGAVTNLFFWSNRYHDRLYEVGFTEASRNFQANNFGRNPGGANANAIAGNDFVRAEGQDSGGTNNANFSTPADGQLPRMQMYVWPGPNPDYDGDLDQTIIIHELTHGTSNRLHANASGLGATTSGGMGEGWGDFYARMILSSPDEDVDGIYTTGGYATHLATGNYTNNYYYGIRRFPHAVMSNVGANGRPHNPLTFADTNPNTIDLTDGAFARGPFGAGGRAGATAVHNVGEVWSVTLMEVRARLIKRLGYAVGNQRMMQITTDAMKLDPVNPTLIQARNALIAADIAGFGGEDVLDIWKGFAIRGMGFGASQTIVNANGKESFDYPIPGMGEVTIVEGSCRTSNGIDPGERLTVSVPLTNPLGQELTGVTASVNGGASQSYGTIAPGATVSRDFLVQVPTGAACGSKLTNNVVVESNLGTETKTFEVRLGKPVLTNLENFDGVAAPGLPAGWTTTRSGGGTAWVTSTIASDTAPNAASTTVAATTGRADLVSPLIAVPATGTTQLTFRHAYNTEFEWDSAHLFINIEGVHTPGQIFDILDAGGSFETGGYTYGLVSTNNGNTNPLAGRAAWTGNSGGFVTSTINLPAAAAGRNVRLYFIAGSDSSFTPAGAHWRVDSISVISSYICDKMDTTTTVDAATVQYSDAVTLSATIGADCDFPEGTLEFKVDGNVVGTATVNGTGSYSVPYTANIPPGPHTITATFTSTNPYFNGSSGSNTLTVTREDASVSFPDTNPFAVKVNTAGGTAGPITICADISEIADGSAGDTTNATATFSFAPVAGNSVPAQSPVTYTGGGVGTARRACVTLASVAVDVYDVTVTVGGYYQGSSSTVLAVYDPSLGFVTGGGTVTNNGNRANFAISVKYLKGGKGQGSVMYIEHNPDGTVTKVKSTAMQSLSIVNGTAVILAKAVVNGVGNHEVRMTAVDNGEPGSSDRLGLAVTGPGKVPVSSLTFAVKTIDGGNIQVPQNPKN